MKNRRIWGLAAALIAALIVIRPDGAKDVLVYTGKGTVQFLWNLIPVFLCVGLMDVWVEKEKMMQIMGTDSGLRGMAISLLIGIVTAVPIYALLPIAGMLPQMERGQDIQCTHFPVFQRKRTDPSFAV